jgi:hypothetical protein
LSIGPYETIQERFHVSIVIQDNEALKIETLPMPILIDPFLYASSSSLVCIGNEADDPVTETARKL